MSFMFELGCEVVSKISGFKGVLTSRSEHLNGCNRYWVAPKVGKDGKLPEGYWIDEAEIQVVKKSNLKPKNQERGGFPSKIK
jgi:hypothetical protein